MARPQGYVERLALPTPVEPLREVWEAAWAARPRRGRLGEGRDAG